MPPPEFDRGTGSRETSERALARWDPRYADVDPGISKLFQTLAYFRNTLSPDDFHRLMGRHESKLYRVLSDFGYIGSYARPDVTLANFDRAYRAWRKIVDSASAGPSVGPPSAIPDRAAHEMWATASGDPIAAAILVMGYLISKHVTERFGWEMDPAASTARAKAVSHGAHMLGGAGVNQITRDKGDRRPSGRPAPSSKGAQQKGRQRPLTTVARAQSDERAEVQRIKNEPSYKRYKKQWETAKDRLDPQDFLTIRPTDVRRKVDIGVMRGSYEQDFAAADRLAGYVPDLPGRPGTGTRPRDLVWHHSEDVGLMFLIPKSVHSAGGGRNLDHAGGSAVHRVMTGAKYPWQ